MNRKLLLLLGLLVVLTTPAVALDDEEDAVTPEFDLQEDEEQPAPKVVIDESELNIGPAPQKKFVEPIVPASASFVETFQGSPFETRWIKSEKSVYAGQPVEVSSGKTPAALDGDEGLVLLSPARHYGVSSKLSEAFVAGDGTTVVQYEVKLQDGLQCGGAYLKLLTASAAFTPKKLSDKTPFTIMFGPDKCGDTNKVHVIIRHQNPVTEEWEEKHLKTPPQIKADADTHLYTLIIRGDNSFEVLQDRQSVVSGSLLEDFEPPFNPPKMIDDPKDKKPADWVDEAKIPDPEAFKPEDWDEAAPRTILDADAEKPEGWLDDAPDFVADPSAEMPEDWDEEEDGEWEAPQVANPACEEAPGCGEWKRPEIPNPSYKGKWSAPMIDNPEYKGEWAPAQIENPAFFEDKQPSSLAPIGGVAVEVWTMQGNIQFDNIYIGSNEGDASDFAASTFSAKVEAEAEMQEYEKRKQSLLSRHKALQSGTLGGKVEFYGGMVLDAISDNLVAFSGAMLVTIVALFYFCCSGGSDDEDYVVDGAADEGEASEINSDGDGSGNGSDGDEVAAPEQPVPAAKEEEPTVRQRKKKRTPTST